MTNQKTLDASDASCLNAGLGARCEGWRRYGGAFTLGPVEWRQCENDAIVLLKVRQEKIEELPACAECWKEVLENKIEILESKPITPNVKVRGCAPDELEKE